MRDPRLTNRAKEMRKLMPEPERRMWHELRAGRMLGVKFRRQKVVGPYILDFAANDPKIVVELDGETHADCDMQDAERTRFLESEGYTVIRFSNSEVCKNMNGVRLKLVLAIDNLQQAPPPTPSPKGEGAIL
ncbi:endonuclease domain-containing protein [Erythrobacter rubeus]|uniref:Endonuclease domain-containing protein n=1 Tax=Erythrobacter rubeus TaxID=2760803 RepID=A0ABR8KSX8_9SPHN|nr:DUF559 domain-containing protein [Erythrobacter rubeus]MBD2841534.1 endonuclease domain-containing protein [Erythrobacter rubeus]